MEAGTEDCSRTVPGMEVKSFFAMLAVFCCSIGTADSHNTLQFSF